MTIRWNTNESATSKVYYATVWPFLLASAPTAFDFVVGIDQEVTLTGLQSDTWYFCVRESADISGNIQRDVHSSFRTN